MSEDGAREPYVCTNCTHKIYGLIDKQASQQSKARRRRRMLTATDPKLGIEMVIEN